MQTAPVKLALAVGLAQLGGCASPIRLTPNEVVLLGYSGLCQDVELCSGSLARCTLEHRVSGGSRASDMTFRRTYLISYPVEDGTYLLTSLAVLSGVRPPEFRSSEKDSITLAFYDSGHKMRTLGLSRDLLELYPLWRGAESQLEQLVQLDLLYGLFYREIAERCIRDDRWENASELYNRAIRKLNTWLEWRWIREGKPGIYEGILEVQWLSFLHSSGRYRESVAGCQEAWRSMTHGVSVSGQDEVTVTVPARTWGSNAGASKPAGE